MPSRRLIATLCFAVLFGLVEASAGDAQVWRKVKEAAGDAVEDETVRAVEDLIRDGVRCVFDDLECIRAAEESGDPVVLTDDEGNIITDDDGAPVTDPPGKHALRMSAMLTPSFRRAETIDTRWCTLANDSSPAMRSTRTLPGCATRPRSFRSRSTIMTCSA